MTANWLGYGGHRFPVTNRSLDEHVHSFGEPKD